MKTLISSFFTFLLIYIQGLESLDCRKFFSKILKCVRNITKNVITTDSFPAKVVIVIGNMWIDMILDICFGKTWKKLILSNHYKILYYMVLKHCMCVDVSE
jgi:hypothetical protein